MAAIDIGAAATDRGVSIGANKTLIGLDNPANLTGTITSVEIWALVNMTGVKVGTFYGTAPDFTSRDVETIGEVEAGAKRTFSGLSIDVEIGDYIGIFIGAAGEIEADSSGGADVYYKTGDQFGAGQQTYDKLADYLQSLYGTGEEIAAAGGASSFSQAAVALLT